MKVLFVTWETFPSRTATSNCLFSIVKELNSKGVVCDIVNISGEYKLSKKSKVDNSIIYNVFESSFCSIKKIFKRNPFLAIFLSLKRLLGFSINGRENKISKKVAKKINVIFSKDIHKYDITIAVCSHVMNAIVCDRIYDKTKIKYIIYQVDPISSNVGYKNKKIELIEFNLFRKAKYVITTPLLYEEIKNNHLYDKFFDKFFVAEFPNVRNMVFEKPNRSINDRLIFFYSGRFYSHIRDCRYALDVFKDINNINFVLLFAGDGQEDVIDDYKARYFGDKIKRLGVISLDESFSMMKKADVLINIGNQTSNQVPSKLFDYISTGKIIINFCQSKECPTIPYINRYRLGLNIIKGEKCIEEYSRIISCFISENIEKTVPFEEIERKFYKNTAVHVGNVFEKLLNDDTNFNISNSKKTY